MCYSNLCSPQIPTEHTADRIPHCCHHVLKQCQCELQVIVGDGSETATIIPNEWRDCFIYLSFGRLRQSDRAKWHIVSFCPFLATSRHVRNPPLLLTRLGSEVCHIKLSYLQPSKNSHCSLPEYLFLAHFLFKQLSQEGDYFSTF